MKSIPQGLRFRLTLWSCLILTVLLTAASGLVYEIVRFRLIHHHDQELEETAISVQQILSEQEDCANLNKRQVSRLDSLSHLVLFHEMGGTGHVFYRSPDSASWPIPDDLKFQMASPDGEDRFEFIEKNNQIYRLYTKPYRSGIGRQGLIRIVERLGDIQEPLGSLRESLLLTVPLAVFLLGLVGYLLVGKALGPVDQITRMAREIGSGDFHRRLPDPGIRDEIGRLVETLNQMIQRLEGSFESMKKFTADASHELRSPLANMRTLIDVALSKSRSARDYQATLASLGEDVDRLRGIAEDLLLLARVDAENIHLEKEAVFLDVIASETVESFRTSALKKRIHLTVLGHSKIRVLGDERWLRQMIVNLVDNAIKYSANSEQKKGLKVSVSIQKNEGQAVLSIEDQGPGVPGEHLERIFDRFYRVDESRSQSSKILGHGLGLSIAAWIANAHGGAIWAENIKPRGLRITVNIPIADVVG